MIKVKDAAYVRLSAPDLERMEQFLRDFGLVVHARDEDTLYARGTDPSPYCHVTERGEPALRAIAFEAASAEDLEAAAGLEGASAVEKIEAPGGGRLVRFQDPDGFTVEIVHGREQLPALEASCASPLNTGLSQPRRGELQRVPPGPASVKRLGHMVIRVSDFQRSSEWYRSRFGFAVSDAVYAGEKDNILTAFLRCDLGAQYSDHHTLLCVGVGEAGFDHVAFEVQDFDAVMAGHDHLAQAGYDHHAGIGRHILGSQVFDYWKDPWGHVHEHFTDGDLLNETHVPGLFDPGTALGTQWGRFGS